LFKPLASSTATFFSRAASLCSRNVTRFVKTWTCAIEDWAACGELAWVAFAPWADNKVEKAKGIANRAHRESADFLLIIFSGWSIMKPPRASKHARALGSCIDSLALGTRKRHMTINVN
jgi:hypothetical protein